MPLHSKSKSTLTSSGRPLSSNNGTRKVISAATRNNQQDSDKVDHVHKSIESRRQIWMQGRHEERNAESQNSNGNSSKSISSNEITLSRSQNHSPTPSSVFQCPSFSSKTSEPHQYSLLSNPSIFQAPNYTIQSLNSNTLAISGCSNRSGSPAINQPNSLLTDSASYVPFPSAFSHSPLYQTTPFTDTSINSHANFSSALSAKKDLARRYRDDYHNLNSRADVLRMQQTDLEALQKSKIKQKEVVQFQLQSQDDEIKNCQNKISKFMLDLENLENNKKTLTAEHVTLQTDLKDIQQQSLLVTKSLKQIQLDQDKTKFMHASVKNELLDIENQFRHGLSDIDLPA